MKWQSLPYSDATWEVASLIERKWPQRIKEFKDREGSKRTPSKACRALKYRPKFVQLSEEPEYFGGYDEVGIKNETNVIKNCIVHFCLETKTSRLSITWCKLVDSFMV